MRKKVLKLFLFLFMIYGFYGFCTSFSISAADSEYSFSFYVGGGANEEIKDGGLINYGQFSKNIDEILAGNTDDTLTIFLHGAPNDSTIEWVPVNPEVFTVKAPTSGLNKTDVALNIIAPGFSGMNVTIKTPDGSVHYAFCTIYVPLQWSDYETSTPANMIVNNLTAEENNGCGLLFANTDDDDAAHNIHNYTLQLFTPESTEHPNQYHYIRKLRYIDYHYHSDNPDTPEDETKLPSVPSNIDEADLGSLESNAAITWFSSNPSVARVNLNTGLVTAVSAGFCTITARTTTTEKLSDESSYAEISYDVIVVPEASVAGFDPVKKCSAENAEVVVRNMDEVTLETNAKIAESLSWRIFRGDVKSANTDITKSLKDDFSISDSNGTVTLSNLKAGVYTITAVPIKSKEKATLSATYDTVTTDIYHISYTIVVPLKFPPESAIMNYYNSNIYDSMDLLANSNLPLKMFRFASMNENIAKVNPDSGVIDAQGEGNVDVTIQLADDNMFKSAFGSYYDKADKIDYVFGANSPRKINITVYNGIAINKSSVTLALGQKDELKLTAPYPYQGKVYWTSSDPSVCSVDEDGIITGKKIGDAIITARIVVGSGVSKRAQCDVKVVTTIDKITLTSKSTHVYLGENLTISAEVTPKLKDVALKWIISDTKIASVVNEQNLSVTIKGEKAGTVVITAVNPANGVVGTMMIDVVSEITEIKLSDTEVTVPKSVGFYQLYATCTPELPENEELIWTSSDKKVVTVDKNGRVSIVKPGTAMINVVTENGKMASCKFTILQGMEKIVLDETSLLMYVGDTYRMSYTLSPETVSNKSLKWSSTDTKIVTVDSTGFFTAKNAGSCVITAQAQDGSGVFTTCKVTVLRNATSISLDVKELTLNVGETYNLETQLKPADSTDQITFESNNTKVALVSVAGKITAKAKGSCVIFARTEGGKSTYCNVIVTQQVTGLKVAPATGKLFKDQTLQLTATISPNNATDKEVVWSTSDKKIATVDKTGLVTAVGPGSTIIKCNSVDGDFMSYSLITVMEKVSSVTLDQESVVIKAGQKIKLEAKVSGEKATNKTVKWASSNKKVVKVTKNGIIKGIKAGKAVIRCKAADGSGSYADCEIRVYFATEEIELSASYAELQRGDIIKLKVTTTPKKVSYPVVWSTSKASVCMINKKGKITAVAPGDCVIRCTAGDDSTIYAECYIHVVEKTENNPTSAPENPDDDMNQEELTPTPTPTPEPTATPTPTPEPTPVPISKIDISEDTVILTVGETSDIQYTVSPAKHTDNISWASDKSSVASVNSKGKVTAKSVGAAKITVTSDSGKTGTVNVYVVGLSKTKITLHQYESTLINLQLDGVDSGKLDVRWDTDNQGIAEIANGKVTGKALGTTTVYAKVNGKYLPCTVKVIKNT